MKYTIIITVYNKEKYIERALKSALNQTIKNYQVMIVNDGSTDNSEKIIKKYQKEYKFKYYKKDNTGIADTRNFAIEKVDTKYFLFLDADDYISLDLLEQADKYSDYDLLSFNAINFDENQCYIKNMNKPLYKGNGEDFFEKLVKEKSEFTVPWGYIYKTEYIKKNEFKYPKGKILEDYYLTPFIIIECKKIISIDYIGYYYITNKNSIINSEKKIIAETYLDHFEKMSEKIIKYNEKTQKNFKSFLAGTLIWYGSLLKGKYKKYYIRKLKSNKIVKLLDRPKIRKTIVNIMFNMNIYYPIRKILKGGR